MISARSVAMQVLREAADPAAAHLALADGAMAFAIG